jgi:dTDP-4-amino-4,6-dideoxygalactose transaminase
VKVPFYDPEPRTEVLAGELRAAFERVLLSGRFILGPEVETFEAELARFVGVRHAIGVSSGSDALLCALSALGIGPGDEVLSTPFTFFATSGAILRLGAVPRYVDVRVETLNIDPRRLEAAIGPRTRAILVVHLFGEPAEMAAIAEVAARHSLPVVEDAAQALGAAFAERRAGAWGKFGCFSFFPSKPLGGFGDGGMVVTDDPALAERCRLLRAHGATRKGEHVLAGYNCRLDALQAALLGVELPRLEGWLSARAARASVYDAAFAGLAPISLLQGHPEARSAHAVYTLRVKNGRRDELARHLDSRGVGTAVYYRTPLHLQPALAGSKLAPGALPESERAAGEVLSLPLFPELRPEQQEHVIASVREFFS